MASPKANIILKKHTQTLKRIFFSQASRCVDFCRRRQDVVVGAVHAINTYKKKVTSVVKKQEEKKTYQAHSFQYWC